MKYFLCLVLLMAACKTKAEPIDRFELVGEVEEDGMKLLGESMKLAAEHYPKLYLMIDSYGGDLDAAFQFSRTLENLKVPVECTVDGDALSAAFFILQSCTVRKATERSVLMAHEPYFRGTVNTSSIQSYAQRLAAFSRQFAGHCVARMKITLAEYIAKTSKTDWWMTPEEALKVGAVDELVASPNKKFRK